MGAKVFSALFCVVATLGCSGADRPAHAGSDASADQAHEDAGTPRDADSGWPTFVEDFSPPPNGIYACGAQLARRIAAEYEVKPSPELAGVLLDWACGIGRDVRPGRGVEIARLFSKTPISSRDWLEEHCVGRPDLFGPSSLVFHASGLLRDKEAIAEYALCAKGVDPGHGLFCVAIQDETGQLVMHVSWDKTNTDYGKHDDATLELSWTHVNVEATSELPTAVSALEVTATWRVLDETAPSLVAINAQGMTQSRTCDASIAAKPLPFTP